MAPSTASQSSLKLTRYLTGATGVAAFLAAPQADAAVVAVQFEFGPVAYGNGVNFSQPYVASTGGGIIDYAIMYGGISLGYIVLNTPANTGNPFFNEGTYANFASSSFPTGASPTFFYFDNGISDELNRNIFFTTQSSHSGWANVTWNQTAGSLTFNSAYLETDSSKGITIGDVGAVPEPSRALLMLAGLGGVALRRRRKLVA